MSGPEANAKAELFSRCEREWKKHEPVAAQPLAHCYVPGRIEVLGKHTDYAGGRSLLCAVERGICAIAAPRADREIHITDVVRDQKCQFTLSPDLDPRSANWAIYPKTVAGRLARNFAGPLSGMDMVFASDLPRASGMSSSSALLIVTCLLLEHCNDLRGRPEFTENIRNEEEHATYLACIENGQSFGTLQGDSGVGTFGGSEDHIAILCSRPATLRQYRFCPARFEREVRLPGELTFVLAASGVAADKTGAAREKYNSAALAARGVLAVWNQAARRTDATLFDAATSTSDAPMRIRELLRATNDSAFPSQLLMDRFDQFFEESAQIIPGAFDALYSARLDDFGNLVRRSQELAEQKLGNQIPQTVELARSALSRGAIAASAFGAGFGGSVWAMVQSASAEHFLASWREQYQTAFPDDASKASFFISAAGPSAFLF